MRVRSLSWEDLLENGMATCSSIVSWRSPWTEKVNTQMSPSQNRIYSNNGMQNGNYRIRKESERGLWGCLGKEGLDIVVTMTTEQDKAHHSHW